MLPSTALADGFGLTEIGFNYIMLTPFLSIFIVVGVGMVGGAILGTQVPAGEGDYNDLNLRLERQARARGLKRDLTKGLSEADMEADEGTNVPPQSMPSGRPPASVET